MKDRTGCVRDQDDVAEFFDAHQAALRQHVVSEILIARDRLTINLARRVHIVLH